LNNQDAEDAKVRKDRIENKFSTTLFDDLGPLGFLAVQSL